MAFIVLKSELPSSGFPSSAVLRKHFQPGERSRDLVSGDPCSRWGLTLGSPSWAGHTVSQDLSVFRSLETRDVPLFDVVTCREPPHPASWKEHSP